MLPRYPKGGLSGPTRSETGKRYEFLIRPPHGGWRPLRTPAVATLTIRTVAEPPPALSLPDTRGSCPGLLPPSYPTNSMPYSAASASSCAMLGWPVGEASVKATASAK